MSFIKGNGIFLIFDVLQRLNAAYTMKMKPLEHEELNN